MATITIGVLWVALIAIVNGAVQRENPAAQMIKPRLRRSSTNQDIYTLDNFISLVEKIERHKLMKNKPLKTIANYVRKLGYNDKKWNTLLGTQSESLPDGVLNKQEEDVLRSMISHGFQSNEERGVIFTPFGDVAMGRVITGICAGTNRNKNLMLPEIYSVTSNHIDNLYASTIAGDLGLTSLVNKLNPFLPLLGPGGTWSPNTKCPQTLNLDMPKHSKATNAQLLGGIDGFLLGNLLPHRSRGGVRLGQLLRMYYKSGDVDNEYYAACRRLNTFNEIVQEKQLAEQVTLAAYAAKAVWNDGIDFRTVTNREIPGIANATTKRFYPYVKNLQSRYKCPEKSDEGCSLPANLVFVLDESGSITKQNYEVEKEFVRNISEAFEISPYQTRVAVIEYSDDAKESIRLGQYYSKSTLLCAVDSLHYAGGYTYTSKALKVAHDILERSQAESAGSDYNKDPQIMILLTDGQSSGGESVLRPIVESIKKNITGITMVAVGVGNYELSELKLIATDPGKHVLETTDFNQLVSLVKHLRNQTCQTAIVLETNTRNYKEGDHDAGDGEKDVEVTGYVDPGKARFFTLSPETLFKTENISIAIKPSFGSVTLYGSRTNQSPGPDDHDFKHTVSAASRQRRSTNSADGKQIEFYNICKGFNKTTCPPLFMSVYGENSTNTCSDLDCAVPSQIKFDIKAAQIIKPVKQEDKMCFFNVTTDKLADAVEVTIKIHPVNDSVTLYLSRTVDKPDENSHDRKVVSKDVGKSKLFTAVVLDPCPAGGKPCEPLYMSLKGSSVNCNCKEDKKCSVPSQATITFKTKAVLPKETKETEETKETKETKETICLFTIRPEKLHGTASVDIKINSVISAVEVRVTRTREKHEKANQTDVISTSAGNVTMMKMTDLCSGYSTCPPLHLTFVGERLSCNCTTDTAGQKQCSLPNNITVSFVKGQVSTANTAKNAILASLLGVILSLADSLI